MTSQLDPSSMSLRRVVREGDARVVVQHAVRSASSSFSQFEDAKPTFVDKTLAIEAFIRRSGGHRLIFVPGAVERPIHSRFGSVSFLIEYFCVC